jgi:hypothetical protein
LFVDKNEAELKYRDYLKRFAEMRSRLQDLVRLKHQYQKVKVPGCLAFFLSPFDDILFCLSGCALLGFSTVFSGVVTVIAIIIGILFLIKALIGLAIVFLLFGGIVIVVNLLARFGIIKVKRREGDTRGEIIEFIKNLEKLSKPEMVVTEDGFVVRNGFDFRDMDWNELSFTQVVEKIKSTEEISETFLGQK